MNRKLLIGALFLGLTLVVTTDSFAQRGSRSSGRGGWGSSRGGSWSSSRSIVRHRPVISHRSYAYNRPYWGRPRIGVSIGFSRPGFGIGFSSMPFGYRRLFIGGMPYFYYNNMYYRSMDNGARYEQIDAPLGATVGSLPSGSRKVTIDGQVYYENRGTYYMPDEDQDGDRIYIVVGRNGELNTREALDNYGNLRYDDEMQEDRDTDEVYRNQESGRQIEAPVNNTSQVQVGDWFEQLPKNTVPVMINGVQHFQSPNGVIYKKVISNGVTSYEVVRLK